MQRSSTTLHGGIKLEPLGNQQKENQSKIKRNRINSAQTNLQSHPCFQSSLFNDGERAAGSIKIWKDRHPELERMQDNARKNFKDYQLENVIWAQSVNHILQIFLEIFN